MADAIPVTQQKDIVRLIPRATAVELSVLPLRFEGDTVVVGVREGSSPSAIDDLTFFLGKNVKTESLSETEIVAGLERLYGSPNATPQVPDPPSSPDQSDEPDLGAVATDGSTIDLANRMIADAISMKASDIHVEPYEKALRVRFRLDGVLHEALKPPKEQAKTLISRLKIMADLDIAEKRRPQDGRIRVQRDAGVIDIRVSTLPTNFGEKVVLRILDKSQLELDLSKLGFEENDLHLFKKTLKLPYGMILVTGPTGSGKTTTLYAALHYINQPERNITTIEDPIEYNLSGVNQTHVRSEIGLTFAASLRSILRQDPNVIMVGEVRDSETAEIAIRAALTGHLVFSTLHTNDASSAITRLVDMGVEPFLVASSVKMILAQRLLRKLCDNCKIETTPTGDQVEELFGGTVPGDANFSVGRGCPVCNNMGYRGRTAVYEVLAIENGLSDMIAKGVTASEMREMARARGVRSLREAAIRKAQRGETSLDEVMRETGV